MNVVFLLFEDAEELDIVGPWEVFTMAANEKPELSNFTVSEAGGIVRCAKGLRLMSDYAFDVSPPADVIVVPGGRGTDSQLDNPTVLKWIREASQNCTWVTSVCAGALLLAEAGPAVGRRVTTHWHRVEQLRKHGQVAEVLENVRYVRDGNLVSSAGVSAGIDMALWLVGEIYDPEFARNVQRRMEYYPMPPYAEKTPSGG